MQTLTATLLAEQKKSRATPYVKVIISDRLGPQQRLHWSRLYSDAAEDEPQAMIVTGDDTIVRVRSHSGTAQYQRVTDPTLGAQWSAWTGGVGTCSTMNQMALATWGAYVWWFYISSDDITLYCRESDDYGATWGSAVAAHTCTGNDRLESVAAAHLSGTDPIVFYSVHNITVTLSCHLYRRKRASGVWQAASSWGKGPVKRVRGLTCHKTGDYNILYGAEVDAQPFGFEAGRYLWCLYAAAYGNGVDVALDTWADPVLVERTDSGTAFATAWPSLTYVDLYLALFTGYLVGEEYSRILRMRGLSSPTFLETAWTDPAPFKAEGGPFGMVLDYRPGGDGYVYAACSNAAYRASAAGLGTVNFTDRVRRYQVRDHWRGHRGAGVAVDYGQLVAPVLEGEIWLDNSDGELISLGSGDYQMVLRGSMVELHRGYLTTAGQESSPWPAMWLEDYEHVVDFQGRCYVVLYCLGGWGLLSAMAARRQYHWQDGEASVWSIAKRLFALAGFDLSSAGEASGEIGTLKPAFLVHPGQDLRGAVLSALSKVGDFLYWEGSTPYVKELASDEESDYTYGGLGEHVIISGRYGVRSPGYDHIEVFAGVDEYGVPLFGDEVDYDEVDLLGHRLQKVYDYSYDTATECDARAVAQLRKHDAAKRRGQIETLPNVGLQLFDVITVTDARAGVSSHIYRVRGIEENYDTTKTPLLFGQRLSLGGR